MTGPNGEAESSKGGSSRVLRKARTTDAVVGGGRRNGRVAQELTPEAQIAGLQAQLERTYVEHDSMVRELYHMEKWIYMTTYDPEVAKKDESPAYQNYKSQSQLDLLERTASSSTGPQRRTRSAQTEKVSFFGQSSSASAPPAKRRKTTTADPAGIRAIITSARSQGKGKEKEAEPAVEVEGVVESISVKTKLSKTKRKGSTTEPAKLPQPQVEAAYGPTRPQRRRRSEHDTHGDALGMEETTIPTKSHGKGKEKAAELSGDVEEPVDLALKPRKGSIRQLAKPLEAEDEAGSSLIPIPPRKRRKGEGGLAPANNTHDPGGQGQASVQREPQSRLTHKLKLKPLPSVMSTTISLRTLAPSSRSEDNPPPPSQPSTSRTGPTTSPIKRVKLIVRKPPPLISNPRQRPPAAKFDGSLEKLVPTFSHWEDEGVNTVALETRIREEAQLRARAARLRQEGRFFGLGDANTSASALLGSNAGTSQLALGSNTEIDLQRAAYHGRNLDSKDVWDHLLEDIVQYDETRRKQPTGPMVTAVVASKVKVYWEVQAVKQDKARAQDEKRLRALAKATVKMVVAEWRKAVFHIREQERLRVEAEERRRGHEHLDAILNQSGQILETQQVDLTRNDLSRSISRSRSVSTSLLHPYDSDDEDNNDDEEVTRRDTDGEDGEEQDDEDEAPADVDLSALYGGYVDQDADESNLHMLSDTIDPGSTRPSTPPARSPSPSIASTRSVTPIEVDTTVPESSSISAFVNITTSDPPIDSDYAFPVIATPPSRSRSSTSDGVVTPPNALVTVQQFEKSDVPPPLDESITDEAIFVHAPAPEEAVKEVVHSEFRDMEMEDAQEQVPASDEQLPTSDELPLADRTPAPDEPPQVIDGEEEEEGGEEGEGDEVDPEIPEYLKPYAVVPVQWDPSNKITPPLLLRGVLRPYQFSGLEWLASLHTNNLNGILADEMGLGKTIQTISLLAHLACDRGIWGPHLIIVPTSVLLNWEMEFKKFLPGFKVLSYHGTTKRRKEIRQGWSEKHHFNVCITSYALASRDAHIFKRKAWYYMILDEAHMIKNFKSQRWNILLMFRSFRRLLLTGTPLQNNLTELWALLQFLMSGANFANLKEFGEWFSNPLEKAIEMGNVLDDENMQRVNKLHTVLRPYLLRRLKRDVEKELPHKYEHLVLCPLSRRQRFLYDEFMARAATQDALQSGVYQKIANILMQLRKVCNHPDLFEVRPIVTSFAMERSAISDYEIKELLIRRRFVQEEDTIGLDFLGLQFVGQQETSLLKAIETRRLDATPLFPSDYEFLSDAPPRDTRTIAGFRAYSEWQRRADELSNWNHLAYVNETRCSRTPIYSSETLSIIRRFYQPILPSSAIDIRSSHMSIGSLIPAAVYSYAERAEQMADIIDRFAFVTHQAVARDLPQIALSGVEDAIEQQPLGFDSLLHRSAVKLQIAFPDNSLLQYDCGKLQQLAELLREKKAGGHRALIFTQMTRILDILEIFLNLHGYLYLRLDGATKIEDRQYITERFNADARVFCFISSSRSGGVGINLTGADTVIFYDSDFNPQMDRQCEDRAHRIGQIRDVHIYRFVSQHTVEEAMLRKANQKRFLDDVVIQKGEFDWRTLFDNEGAIAKALGEFEDTEDAHAAELATQEATTLEGADNDDFGGGEGDQGGRRSEVISADNRGEREDLDAEGDGDDDPELEDEEGGTVVEYMLAFIERDPEHFQDWRV
ncbi:swr1 complex component [Marasmius sp. AFHP31]|nr:swr1 complex component [Marasmius sp. AFHP31]